MLFRRCASLVDAIHLDGTDAALRAALALPRARPSARPGEVVVATASGRRVAGSGSWITRDIATQAVRLYDERAFEARHEAVL